MATDDDYMAFLNKANKDVGDGQTVTQQQQSKEQAVFKCKDAGIEVPKPIQDVCKDAFYVTDADEPFEEVSLKWDKESLPNEDEFAKLIEHWDVKQAQIEILDPLNWDSRGQYIKVIDAVREATQGNDVRVYRVVRDETRAEYWVLSWAPGKLVGVKALGVES
ncbi:hypothetical protein CDD81_3257 [Ophiocordyceps australis]|uniref:Uncharacterized protein n=1 Tax=Ophiocordyceps australis TaxID=1399860 RepID=A0A2C5YBN5_9HYPO|nr:hypothetical protein CDD81_3257 [Ophiocordyceps australis]